MLIIDSMSRHPINKTT